MKDPNLIAEAKKMNLEIDPMSGEEVQALVEKAYASPAQVVERAKEALDIKE